MKPQRTKKGIAIIVCMVFLCIFSTLSIAMVRMAGSNVKVADSYRTANKALTNSLSGLEVMRYYLNGMRISGTVAPQNRLAVIASGLCTTGSVYASYDSLEKVVQIYDIHLDTSYDESFNASISHPSVGGVTDYDTIQLNITGTSHSVQRRIRTSFQLAEIGNTVFDFGVATKGPLSLSGQSTIDGTATDPNLIAIEASVYIEGVDAVDGDSFSIGNKASIAGNVSIANPSATYSLLGQSSIGGVTGAEAEENITVGVDYVDFPIPNPDYFYNLLDPDECTIISDNSYDNHSVLTNVIIEPNTNPTFASSVTINGILYVKQPNNVKFVAKTTLNAIIVCDGALDGDTYGSLDFAGQVIANDVSTLVGDEYDYIRDESGTFILAPGFEVDFSGQADHTINGAIAASGVEFSGQASGTVNGSIINYSEDTMNLLGQTGITFNRSDCTTNPAGFIEDKIVEFLPTSYSEQVL